jgi:L-alanine-DL-glutamate epimerase-like enolase superfamily enzyme
MGLIDYSLRKLRVPLGRSIGDNNCTYDSFDVICLILRAADGTMGYGFGEKAHGGRFNKQVSWKAEMAPLAEVEKQFSSVWPELRDRPAEDLLEALPWPWEPWQVSDFIHAALRMALWDLRGRAAGRPLFQVLGTEETPSDIFAYFSPCGFPLQTVELARLFRAKAQEGFTAFKVKVGHADIEWDVARLRAIREAVGPDAEIAVDGNTAWDGPGTLRWIERVMGEGLAPAYIEDPVWPEDIEAFRLLAAESPLPLVGHDYLPDPEGLRPLLDTGALRAIRMRDGIDHAMASAKLADEYDIGLIQCNTFGEHSIHFALTHPRVERMEFADLGWNKLFENPVRAVQGRLIAPSGPGLGLVPKPDNLQQLSVDS